MKPSLLISMILMMAVCACAKPKRHDQIFPAIKHDRNACLQGQDMDAASAGDYTVRHEGRTDWIDSKQFGGSFLLDGHQHAIATNKGDLVYQFACNEDGFTSKLQLNGKQVSMRLKVSDDGVEMESMIDGKTTKDHFSKAQLRRG